MIRTVGFLQRVDAGFDASNRLLFQAYLAFHQGQTPVERQQHYDELRLRVAALPGVRAVGVGSILPFAALILTGPFAHDAPTVARWGALTADYRAISPGYFEAIGARLRGGRFFDEHDGVSSQQVIVDENLARLAWRGRNPVGQKLWVMNSFDGLNHVQADVVGVVQHLRDDHLDSEGRPQIYLPASLAMREGIFEASSFCVRTDGDPLLLIPEIRRVAADLDRSAPVSNFESLDGRVRQAMAGTRFELTLMSVFAGIAVVLALVGLYGVISYLVNERWREMGIRIALGATPHDVRRLVMSHGLRLTAAGILCGLICAFLVTPMLRSLLYGVAPLDVFTYTLLSALMLTVSILACWIPACRATKADPIEAMRSE
jgi:predicted permease